MFPSNYSNQMWFVFKEEKMFFKVNSVCVFGLIIFSRRNRAKWSFGNIFSHFHVLMFQRKLDRAEMVQFQ